MAVPTIYFKLIRYWNDHLPNTEKEKLRQQLRHFRLMVLMGIYQFGLRGGKD